MSQKEARKLLVKDFFELWRMKVAELRFYDSHFTRLYLMVAAFGGTITDTEKRTAFLIESGFIPEMHIKRRDGVINSIEGGSTMRYNKGSMSVTIEPRVEMINGKEYVPMSLRSPEERAKSAAKIMKIMAGKVN